LVVGTCHCCCPHWLPAASAAAAAAVAAPTAAAAAAVQRTDSCFLIGETQPTAAANTDTSDSNAARILQLAAAAVPVLAAASVQGVHVGCRPYPADGYPVLGWVPGCRNAYVAGAVDATLQLRSRLLQPHSISHRV
jgi:glycine/D-amino acid oxidase-like deaminating enzyme